MHKAGLALFGMLKATFLYPLAERKMKRSISPKLRILRAEAALPFRQRKALARQALIDTLTYAGRTVPYYKDVFARHNFNPENIEKDIRYLEDIPYLTKDILIEHGDRLISEALDQAIIRRQRTGSSTGPAATVCYDQEGLDWTAAQNILMLEWGGKRCYDREVHLSTRFPTHPSPADLDFERRKCFVLNRRNVYTGGFGDAAQETLLADLRRAGARLVQGHPSTLYALARYLEKNGRREAGLFEIFVSTGEMITARQRTLIENVLSARVSNRYGACEFGVMAQECANGPKGELMVSDSLVWPEVRPMEHVEAGELVFTSLRNMAMPLIRYRMGDLGRLEERDDGWWITELTGRSHDAVRIDGELYPTHYVQDILDRCGPISDFQILVRNGEAAELRLVVSPDEWEAVSAAVQNYFPSLPLRRIEPEELIFVGIRGKFSYLVRERA